jgi:hypothetical protein
MSKIALITDLHFGVRNDSLIYLNYFEKFYKEQFFPYLIENGIGTIINLGDTFDRRKFISFNTLRRAKEMFFDVAFENGITIHTIIGNHDTTYKNTNELNGPDQLLREYTNIHIYSEPEEIDLFCTGELFAFIPWITADNQEKVLKFIQDTKAKIAFGHFELNGYEVLRGIKMEHGMEPDILSKFEAVFSGHFHSKHDKRNIYYLGTPYELYFSDLYDNKGFHIFDTETRELEFIINPRRLFHRIYYDDKGKTYQEVVKKVDYLQYKDTYVKVVVVRKTNNLFLEKFLDKLYSASPVDVKVVDEFKVDIEGNLLDDSISLAEDTLSVLNKYVDSIESLKNNETREKLKNLLSELYKEAQMIEE